VAAVDIQIARTLDDRTAGDDHRQQVNGQGQEIQTARAP